VRELLEQSFHYALGATHPKRLTQAHLHEERPALVVSVGKAALTMLDAALERYRGVPFIAVSKDDGQPAPQVLGGEVLLSAHPTPDGRSVRAGERVLEGIAKLGPDELLLLLISGGGSSLLCGPWGIGLEQKQYLTQALLRSGADIQEMNAVRKHLSSIKGGRLAVATEARVLALYLSDVPGDDLSVIASGPTVPDPSTFADALGILDKYTLDVPGVRRHLSAGLEGQLPESPKPGDPRFARVENRLIGSNQHLLGAAQEFWRKQGYQAVILSDRFQGEAREMARFHAGLIGSIRAHHTPFKPPVVLLSGGEAGVSVRGSGKGGRSQEFMLALLHHLGQQGVYGLAADSDGIDGNTEAAGAFLAPDSYARAKALGLEVRQYLERNDAYGFFKALKAHLITGPTHNNLNDFRVLVVD
jgi:hydroxypyruvate reductase